MKVRTLLACATTLLCLTAAPTFASAHTFSGTCDLVGTGDNIPPGSMIAPGYEFKSKGTCTGSLDRGPSKTHLARNVVHAAGANAGPLPVIDGATGSVTFIDGERHRHKRTVHFRFSQLTLGFLISGDRGGNAFGYGTPSGDKTHVHVQTLTPLSG